ncbi:MAG: imelysin family protein [Flavobacteriales bacterium]
MNSKAIILSLLVFFSLAFSCVDNSKDEPKTNYKDLFENLAQHRIRPTYTAFLTDLTTLNQKVEQFDNQQSEQNLEALRTAFKSNYLLWQSVSMFNFGPAKDADVLLDVHANTFPTDVDLIEDNIQTGNTNFDAANQYAAQGFPALEFLLYGDGQTTTELLASFEDENRRDYLKAIIDVLITKVELINTRWETYESTFSSNSGTGNASSLTLLFNAYLEHYEHIKRDKFALPAGYASSFGVSIDKDSKKVEGLYSELSFQLMLAALEAQVDCFRGLSLDGAEGVGFEDKLIELSAKSDIIEGPLNEAILTQLSLAKSALSSYSNAFDVEIENSNSQLEETNTILQKVVPMLKIELRNYLEVPLTSSDSDGD